MSYHQFENDIPYTGTYLFERDSHPLAPYDTANANIWNEYAGICHGAQITTQTGIYNNTDGSYSIIGDKKRRNTLDGLDFKFNYLSFAYKNRLLHEISLDELTMPSADQTCNVPIADLMRIPLTSGTQGNFEVVNFTLANTYIGNYLENRIDQIAFNDPNKIYFKNNRFQDGQHTYKILPTGEILGQWKPTKSLYQSDGFTLREYLTGPNAGIVAARYQTQQGLMGNFHDQYGNQHIIGLWCGLILETNRNNKKIKNYSMNITMRGAIPRSLEFNS